MILGIAGIMNSIAIVILAVVSVRHTNQIKKNNIVMQSEWQWKSERQNAEIMNLNRRTDVLEEDLKNIRLEMKGMEKRQPVPEEHFERDLGVYYDFGNGNFIKQNVLDYIADIGLKAIASELPEKKRTLEITTEIIERMKRKLQKNKIVSE